MRNFDSVDAIRSFCFAASVIIDQFRSVKPMTHSSPVKLGCFKSCGERGIKKKKDFFVM